MILHFNNIRTYPFAVSGTGADHVQEFFTIAATLLLLPLEIVGAIAVLWFSVSLASLGALLCVGIVLLAQVRGGRRLETTQIEYDAEVAGLCDAYFVVSTPTIELTHILFAS